MSRYVKFASPNVSHPAIRKKRLERHVGIMAHAAILKVLPQQREGLWCKQESCLQFLELSYRLTSPLQNFLKKV